MVACTHEEFEPQPPNGEHPIVAVIAVVAMIAAMLLITWVRFEVHGTSDIEAALTEEGPADDGPRADEERELDAAVTSNRFATGVSAH
jgi:hypothetical protein